MEGDSPSFDFGFIPSYVVSDLKDIGNWKVSISTDIPGPMAVYCAAAAGSASWGVAFLTIRPRGPPSPDLPAPSSACRSGRMLSSASVKQQAGCSPLASSSLTSPGYSPS